MVLIQAKRFLTKTGSDPVNCEAASGEELYIELVFQSEYTADENASALELAIRKTSDNSCVKKFSDAPNCIHAGKTYTWVTPLFTLTSPGEYYIGVGSTSSPECYDTDCAEGRGKSSEVITLKGVTITPIGEGGPANTVVARVQFPWEGTYTIRTWYKGYENRLIASSGQQYRSVEYQGLDGNNFLFRVCAARPPECHDGHTMTEVSC